MNVSSGKSGKLQQRLSISGRKVFKTGRAEPLCLPRLDPRPADPSWKLKSQHLQATIIERCSEAPYELVYLNNDRQASPHPQVPSQLLAELPLHVAAHWDQVDHLDQSATTAL